MRAYSFCCRTFAAEMKYLFGILLLIFLGFFPAPETSAQCSVCTKTSLQLGEKPAQGMNSAILYLMMMPFAIAGFIGYRWWKNNKKFEEQEAKGSSTP